MHDPMDAVCPARGTDDSGCRYTDAADSLPTVACVLIVADESRVPFARVAVNQFVAQTYPNKRLLLANASGRPVTNIAHPEIEEFIAGPGTIGCLRNQALARIKNGSWFVRLFWDDDDCFPPDQLAYQMLFRDHDRAVMLARQVIVLDVPKADAAIYVRHRPWGIPNTALVPRWLCNHLFDEAGFCGEDIEFIQQFRKADKVAVVDNAKPPVSCISVAVYHGRNASPREAFLGERDPIVQQRSLLVSAVELDLINRALAPHQTRFARA